MNPHSQFCTYKTRIEIKFQKHKIYHLRIDSIAIQYVVEQMAVRFPLVKNQVDQNNLQNPKIEGEKERERNQRKTVMELGF